MYVRDKPDLEQSSDQFLIVHVPQQWKKFPLPYLWTDQKLDVLFMTVAAGTVDLNIYEGLLLVVLSIMMEK